MLMIGIDVAKAELVTAVRPSGECWTGVDLARIATTRECCTAV